MPSAEWLHTLCHSLWHVRSWFTLPMCLVHLQAGWCQWLSHNQLASCLVFMCRLAAPRTAALQQSRIMLTLLLLL